MILEILSDSPWGDVVLVLTAVERINDLKTW